MLMHIYTKKNKRQSKLTSSDNIFKLLNIQAEHCNCRTGVISIVDIQLIDISGISWKWIKLSLSELRNVNMINISPAYCTYVWLTSAESILTLGCFEEHTRSQILSGICPIYEKWVHHMQGRHQQKSFLVHFSYIKLNGEHSITLSINIYLRWNDGP